VCRASLALELDGMNTVTATWMLKAQVCIEGYGVPPTAGGRRGKADIEAGE